MQLCLIFSLIKHTWRVGWALDALASGFILGIRCSDHFSSDNVLYRSRNILIGMTFLSPLLYVKILSNMTTMKCHRQA